MGEFQEFKREAKEVQQKTEAERIRQELEENIDQAQWRAEVQRALFEEEQAVLMDKQEDMQEVKEIKVDQERREKQNVQIERNHEQVLDATYKVNQVSAEKAEMMRRLEFLRNCQQKGPANKTRPVAKRR